MAFQLLKRRDTGWIEITHLVPGRISGTLTLRRTGETVWLRFSDLVCEDPSNTWHSWSRLIPVGFRGPAGYTYGPLAAPVASIYTEGPIRVDGNGNLVVYQVTGQKRMAGTFQWPTDDPMPTGGA